MKAKYLLLFLVGISTLYFISCFKNDDVVEEYCSVVIKNDDLIAPQWLLDELGRKHKVPGSSLYYLNENGETFLALRDFNSSSGVVLFFTCSGESIPHGPLDDMGQHPPSYRELRDKLYNNDFILIWKNYL